MSGHSSDDKKHSALARLLNCIDGCKGHGVPIIRDRAECYLAMQDAEEALKAIPSSTASTPGTSQLAELLQDAIDEAHNGGQEPTMIRVSIFTLDTVVTALKAIPSASASSSGWQAVPVEITEDMRDSLLASFAVFVQAGPYGDKTRAMNNLWSDVLAIAPKRSTNAERRAGAVEGISLYLGTFETHQSASLGERVKIALAEFDASHDIHQPSQDKS